MRIVIAGGRVWGARNAPFELEESLLGELMRALRRPAGKAPMRATGTREDWYGPFLEALGCMQRTDDPTQLDRAIELLEGIRDAGAGGVQVHAALGRAYLRRAEISHDPKWHERAEAVATVRVSYAEARAAFARHRREGGLRVPALRRVVSRLDGEWGTYNVVEVSDPVVRRAGALAERHALRGYDAVQLAAALDLRDAGADLAFACFDDRLARAALRERLRVAGS